MNDDKHRYQINKIIIREYYITTLCQPVSASGYQLLGLRVLFETPYSSCYYGVAISSKTVFFKVPSQRQQGAINMMACTAARMDNTCYLATPFIIPQRSFMSRPHLEPLYLFVIFMYCLRPQFIFGQ